MVERVFGHEALVNCFRLHLGRADVRLSWCWFASRTTTCYPNGGDLCRSCNGRAGKFDNIVVDDGVCLDGYD